MKKTLTIVTLASAMLLAGCSSNNSSNSSDSSAVETSQSSTTATSSQQVSSSSPSQVDTTKVGFSNGITVLDGVTMEVTNHKVIQSGEDGNKSESKPTFAVWYKITNKTDGEINALVSLFSVFNAYQNDNTNKENKLKLLGAAPDQEQITPEQLTGLQKDETLEIALSYELINTTTPVKLVATKGISGGNIGEQTFEIK